MWSRLFEWVIEFAECSQQDATFHSLFIAVRRSTVFRWFFHPSSVVQNCTYSVRPLLLPAARLARLSAGSSNGLTNTWRSMCSFELLMMEETPSETCRATYRNKLWNVASCWLYCANILAMHGPMNVKSESWNLQLWYIYIYIYISVCVCVCVCVCGLKFTLPQWKILGAHRCSTHR